MKLIIIPINNVIKQVIPKEDVIPISSTVEMQKGYLAGMIDGEGCVDINNKRIQITNTEEAIIKETIKCLEALEISYKVYQEVPNGHTKNGEPYKLRHDIVINGIENLRKVLAEIPIHSNKKLNKLKLVIDDYKISSYTKEPTKDLLNYLYNEKKMSLVEIATYLNTSLTTTHR